MTGILIEIINIIFVESSSFFVKYHMQSHGLITSYQNSLLVPTGRKAAELVISKSEFVSKVDEQRKY